MKQEFGEKNLRSPEDRFHNITGGWTREMELRIKGPRSIDPVLFGVGKMVISFVGSLKHPTSTSIVRTNARRRSLALWTDG